MYTTGSWWLLDWRLFAVKVFWALRDNIYECVCVCYYNRLVMSLEFWALLDNIYITLFGNNLRFSRHS
jgi:hypothetical protein